MEILNFFLLVALLIIIIINHSALKNRIDKISRELNNLRVQPGDQLPKKEPIKETVKEPVLAPPVVEKAEPAKQEATLEIRAEHPLISSETPAEPIRIKTEERSYTQNVQKPDKPKVKGDLEKFIGENLMSKIGIAILVLGIGYFVKYAIDKDYINEFGRMAIGFIAGGGIIALAHRMRKDYKTFASILIGGGLAILYTTVTIAYQLYNLFPQAAAFAVLIIITAFAVLLSLLYDKRELAIFSLIGGFASPFMVSSGSGNYVVLFSYLLILNAGMVVIAWHKRWNILNLLGYIFTIVLFGSWLADTFMWNTDKKPYAGAIVFATLFYLGFFLVNILNNIRRLKPFNAMEIGMILSNNLFYFLCGLLIFSSIQNGMYKGLFTVLIAIYNFGWVMYLYKKQQIDKTLIYLLIGLVLSFISLAVPIQLNGHSITLFWAAELVILLWIWQVSGIRILKVAHLIILALTIISLLMDWNNGYVLNTRPLPVVFNQICITGLVVMAAIGLSIYLLKKEAEPVFIKYLLEVKTYSMLLSVLLFAGLYAVLLYELVYQMNIHYGVSDFRQVVYGFFNFTYVSLFVALCRYQKWLDVEKILYFISLLLLFVFLVVYSFAIVDVRNGYLWNQTLSHGNYLFHYLIYPGVAAVLAFVIGKRNEVFKAQSLLSRLALWYTTVFIVVTASIELDNLVLYLNKPDMYNKYALLQQVHQAGYPILWAAIAFVLMVIGMKGKNKIFRIQSISILGLIIGKLLLVDFWQMEKGGRIITLISLGVIFLVISFLYQKLKVLISGEDQKDNN